MNNLTMQSNLPILKHFDESQITDKVDAFRKGEMSIYTILKVAVFGGLGYLTWVYVLPPLFIMLGQMAAIFGAIVGVVAFIFAIPSILKWLRVLTRKMHESAIRHNPFQELEEQRKKMAQNKVKFQASKGKITDLKSKMEIGASDAENKAKEIEKEVLRLNKKAKEYKIQLDEITKKLGAKAKETDEYVNTYASYTKVLSTAQRRGFELAQEKDFVIKYGTRGAIMKKFAQKLVLVEVSMDNKIADFDTTIIILKKDYQYAKEAKEGTQAAKEAMGMTNGWELGYALDVVTSTIAQDIAITTGNLNDIDSLTSMYNLDSDDLYANLELLADEINTGKNAIPEAKAYHAQDYQLSSEDKLKSGGFDALNEQMF